MHGIDRKTPNIDTIFKDNESGLDISQNINASKFLKTKKTLNPLQNVFEIGRQPEDKPEITSNINMLHGENQFESALRRLHVHGTL